MSLLECFIVRFFSDKGAKKVLTETRIQELLCVGDKTDYFEGPL